MNVEEMIVFVTGRGSIEKDQEESGMGKDAVVIL